MTPEEEWKRHIASVQATLDRQAVLHDTEIQRLCAEISELTTALSIANGEVVDLKRELESTKSEMEAMRKHFEILRVPGSSTG